MTMGGLVDQVYRSFVISKFFSRGWGDEKNLKRLFDFRKNIANRESCMKLVEPDHPVTIDKVQLDDSGEFKLIDGHFKSPLVNHLPGLLPKVAENAHFQLVVPADKWRGSDRPICIQTAGTGDHYFWRRRKLLSLPLLKDHGISSLILENPFYGVRKPKEQFRSSLLNVSDIFVMGGSLVLEGIVLLQWLEKEGYGPMVLHGISMGGFMSSLMAASWHKPVGLVPCLSWTTASAVFTQGVMRGAIDWKSLEQQFISNTFLKDELYQMVLSNNDEAYLAGKDFAGKALVESSAQVQTKNIFQSLTNFLKERGLIKILPELNTLATKPTNDVTIDPRQIPEPKEYKIMDFTNMILGKKSTSKVQKEAIQFMRGVMDEFTHLKNFEKPVDPSMVIVVAARDDAYIPREGYKPIDEIWPGCEVKFVQGGHISSYLIHQGVFKKTIADAVDRYRRKYHVNGVLRDAVPAEAEAKLPNSQTDRNVMDVLGLRSSQGVTDSSTTRRM